MPQVWLKDEELGEFLGSDAVEARHHAIQNGWSRRLCPDDVMRWELPPKSALAYVLANAKARPEPRDAVLHEAALERIEQLQRELADAARTIRSLQREIAALHLAQTDESVRALRAVAAEMQAQTADEPGQNRSVA